MLGTDKAGVELELVSPERMSAPEVGGMNHVPYATALQNTMSG
jgi:hypothetical protein